TSTAAWPGAASEAPTPDPSTPGIARRLDSCTERARRAAASQAGSTVRHQRGAASAGDAQPSRPPSQRGHDRWLLLAVPTRLTPNVSSTLWIGLAKVLEPPPAKSSPTARGGVESSTISDPESPAVLTPAGVIRIWLAKRAIPFPPPHGPP